MQNLNEMLTEENYVNQTHQINQTLASLIQTKHFNAQPTSWEDVQKIVRAGRASRVFSIGDQLTCQRGNNTLVWDVIG
ncbi:MAG: hypothetical protein II828_08575, partial [Clostridia bacterium]|nr:hypothetical protein [Clostridia bacterium]